MSLKRIQKATQAFVEIEHRRFQINQYKTTIVEKDTTIARLKSSVDKLYQVNKEFEAKEGLYNKQKSEYQAIVKDYKSEKIKADFRMGFMKIGTPLIAISVGVICFYGGYQLGKILK